MGQTTEGLARDVYKFVTEPGQRVVVVCQSITDNAPLKKLSSDIQRMLLGLQTAGLELKFGTESATLWTLPKRDSTLQIIEAGASEAAAQKKGRAGTYTRIHITEVGFFEHPELTMNALLEGVPSGGGTEVQFESTPNGAGNWFHNLYLQAESGTNGYHPHFFPWFDEPAYALPLLPHELLDPESEREEELVTRYMISPEQLKWYRRKVAEKGQSLVDQEYPTDAQRCFLVSGRTFFDREVTESLFSRTRNPVAKDLGGALWIWRQPEKYATYLISADPSEGTGGDPGAALVWNRKTGEHVATLHGQLPPWKMAELLASIGERYNGATLVVERNNHGHAVLQALEKHFAYPAIYRDADEKLGWLSGEIKRSAALDSLEAAHREGRWSTPDQRILGEFRTFVFSKTGKAEAARGAHDDLVLAAAIGHDVLSKPIGRVVVPTKTATPFRMGGASRGFG
jgi:hypothetical protein